MSFTMRPIEPRDDAAVAAVIRSVMPEFGAAGPGFAIHDPEVNGMWAAYQGPRSRYFVVEKEGRVVGGAGFAPLEGGEAGTCELRKMYFLPEARGGGVGSAMLGLCLEEAKRCGYQRCYLETLSTMTAAQKMYMRHGFEKIGAAKGATGHFGCDCWYEKVL
jgi:putative acetyltransferase